MHARTHTHTQTHTHTHALTHAHARTQVTDTEQPLACARVRLRVWGLEEKEDQERKVRSLAKKVLGSTRTGTWSKSGHLVKIERGGALNEGVSSDCTHNTHTLGSFKVACKRPYEGAPGAWGTERGRSSRTGRAARTNGRRRLRRRRRRRAECRESRGPRPFGAWPACPAAGGAPRSAPPAWGGGGEGEGEGEGGPLFRWGVASMPTGRSGWCASPCASCVGRRRRGRGRTVGSHGARCGQHAQQAVAPLALCLLRAPPRAFQARKRSLNRRAPRCTAFD